METLSLKRFIRVVTLGKISFKKYAYEFSVNLFDRNTLRGYHKIFSPFTPAADFSVLSQILLHVSDELRKQVIITHYLQFAHVTVSQQCFFHISE